MESKMESSKLKNEIKELRKQNRLCKSKKFRIEQCKKVLLDRGFSRAEINFHLFGKHSRNLNDKEVANGIVLRAISRKAFRYVMKKGTMYLPGKTTINKRKAKYTIRYGFQENLLRFAIFFIKIYLF